MTLLRLLGHNRLWSSMCAGQEVEVDLEKDVLTVLESGKQYALKSIGEV